MPRSRASRAAAILGILAVLILPAWPAAAQSLSVSLGSGSGQSLTANIVGLIAITSVLAVAPGILVVATAFTRLVIVLSFLRTALGLQQSPPNMVIVSLALFLTAFIMAPAFETAYRDAIAPLADGSITEEQALDRGIKPFRGFMEANTRDKDLALFIDLAGWHPPPAPANGRTGLDATPITATAVPAAHPPRPGSIPHAERREVPLHILCSAFLTSELSRGFQIGFLLFLPFLVIDLVVSSVLMGMGMMMLPPVVVSLPFKLIFFVLIDGWELIAGSLVRSFAS
jgi:flagellar biosynthetic protein FliP